MQHNPYHAQARTYRPTVIPYAYSGIGQAAPPSTDEMRQAVAETAKNAVREAAKPAIMIGFGIGVGAAAGAVGGLLGRTVSGGLLGAVGGGVLGWMAFRSIQSRTEPTPPATSGLGILAVL